MKQHIAGWVAGGAAGLLLAAASLAGTTARAAPGTARPALAQKFDGRLYGVAATSAANAWAVGLGPSSSLIVHWNGRTWSQALTSSGFFESVAAASARDAWAVGGTDWFSPDPLIYHWNGSAWTQVTVPAPPAGGYLNAVTVRSSADVWAVGLAGGSPAGGTGPGNAALIYHWNGQAWTQVPCPDPGPASGLNGVSATSAADAWAVGWTGLSADNGTMRTLILHWDGHAWTRVPSPSGKPGLRASLQAVVALSARNAWAVGGQHENRNRLVFIVHWNGTAWTRYHSPTPHNGAMLLGAAAASAHDVWAVGETSKNGGCPCFTAVVHWNGHHWSVVPSPNLHGRRQNLFWDVTALSARNAWAVGTTDYDFTLIAHWNGRTWS